MRFTYVSVSAPTGVTAFIRCPVPLAPKVAKAAAELQVTEASFSGDPGVKLDVALTVVQQRGGHTDAAAYATQLDNNTTGYACLKPKSVLMFRKSRTHVTEVREGDELDYRTYEFKAWSHPAFPKTSLHIIQS